VEKGKRNRGQEERRSEVALLRSAFSEDPNLTKLGHVAR